MCFMRTKKTVMNSAQFVLTAAMKETHVKTLKVYSSIALDTNHIWLRADQQARGMMIGILPRESQTRMENSKEN